MPKDDFLKSLKKGFKGAKKEVKEERVGEEARRASGKKKERTNGRKEKAEKITRLMKKGYRKGYRVGEEPGGMSREPLSRPRNPFGRKSKRGSERKSAR